MVVVLVMVEGLDRRGHERKDTNSHRSASKHGTQLATGVPRTNALDSLEKRGIVNGGSHRREAAASPESLEQVIEDDLLHVGHVRLGRR